MNMGIHCKRQGDRQIIALGIIEQGKRSFQQTGLVFLPAAIIDLLFSDPALETGRRACLRRPGNQARRTAHFVFASHRPTLAACRLFSAFRTR